MKRIKVNCVRIKGRRVFTLESFKQVYRNLRKKK